MSLKDLSFYWLAQTQEKSLKEKFEKKIEKPISLLNIENVLPVLRNVKNILFVEYQKNIPWLQQIQLQIFKDESVIAPVFFLIRNEQELEFIQNFYFDDYFYESTPKSECLAKVKWIINRRDKDKSLNQNLVKKEIILKQREEFLAVCSHDLRSPLGLIESSSKMVLKELSQKNLLSSVQYELLSRIQKQATYGLTLVKDLLDIMSFEQGYEPKYSLIGLDTILKDFLNDFKNQAKEKKIEFEYQNTIPNFRVFADIDRLQQVLHNLMANALKFSEANKKIFLTVSPFTGRRKGDPPYPMVMLSLKDEGKGIPKRELQRIFDRFSQVREHSKSEGRGLGLSVAKQISHLHAGNLWVESEIDKGSTFHLLLPHAVGGEMELSNREKPLLLVLEGNPKMKVLEGSGLDKFGTVIVTKDAIDALCHCFYYRPSAFFTTSRVSKMNLIEMIDILKRDSKMASLPLVLVNEEGNSSIETHKFDRVLRNPFTEDDLKKLFKSIVTPIRTLKAA